MIRVCVLFTGGKDSTYSLYWALLHGFKVVGLVALTPRSWESMLFHYPGVSSGLVDLAAKAIGLPLLKRSVDGDEEESLVKALLEAKRLFKCEGIVSGALLSDYQRIRFSLAAEEAGLKSYTPLWRKSQEEYMRSIVMEGFKVMVLSVQAYGLPENLVGKVLTLSDVEEVIRLSKIYGFNPAFEGGEAETLVVDSPIHRYRIVVKGERKRVAPYHYVFEVTSAWLVDKGSNPILSTSLRTW